MSVVLAEEFESYWSAVAATDDHRATRVAAAALERGVGLDVVLTELVVASQRRVGSLWEAGDWSVPREHAATAVNEHVVRQLCREIPEDPEGQLLLVACAEREWHALPALVITQLLQVRGARAEYLGPNTSREHMVARILDRGPRAVLLSASLSSSLPRVRRQIEAIRGTGTPVIVGGSAFDVEGHRARQLGASGHAASADEALDLIAGLPRHVTPAPSLRHQGAVEAMSILAAADSLNQSLVSAVHTSLGVDGDLVSLESPDDWRVLLTTSVSLIIDCVAGGLLTEDSDVLAESRAWLQRVMVTRGAPDEAVSAVWVALARQLRDHPEATRMLAST